MKWKNYKNIYIHFKSIYSYSEIAFSTVERNFQKSWATLKGIAQTGNRGKGEEEIVIHLELWFIRYRPVWVPKEYNTALGTHMYIYTHIKYIPFFPLLSLPNTPLFTILLRTLLPQRQQRWGGGSNCRNPDLHSTTTNKCSSRCIYIYWLSTYPILSHTPNKTNLQAIA